MYDNGVIFLSMLLCRRSVNRWIHPLLGLDPSNRSQQQLDFNSLESSRTGSGFITPLIKRRKETSLVYYLLPCHKEESHGKKGKGFFFYLLPIPQKQKQKNFFLSCASSYHIHIHFLTLSCNCFHLADLSPKYLNRKALSFPSIFTLIPFCII